MYRGQQVAHLKLREDNEGAQYVQEKLAETPLGIITQMGLWDNLPGVPEFAEGSLLGSRHRR